MKRKDRIRTEVSTLELVPNRKHIYQCTKTKQFWFADETTERCGPYDTLAEVSQAFSHYVNLNLNPNAVLKRV